MLKGGATALKDKITAFERRIEMLFFLTKQRKSSIVELIVELAENYSVCRKTAYNDIMFLSRYAHIYTKGGVNGGVFLMDDYRNSMFLYLSCDEESLLYRIMATLPLSEKNIVANIINKYSQPKTAT